jgi:D-3-phosphoglycerate dehydrogenase
MSVSRIAVTSRSFSKNPILRAELQSRYAKITFNDAGTSLAGDALVAFLRGHDGAITALERIDDALLASLPELKIIGKFGVGIDMIDLDAMDRRGVRLGWQGGTNRRSVSELALTLILSLLRHLTILSVEVRKGTFRQLQGRCLSGRTVGLVGCGNVGKDLILLLKPFGCRVLCHDAFPDMAFLAAQGAASVGLEPLLREADIVSVHLPLNEATRGMLDAEKLAWMKPGSLLINTARGHLVDQAAMKDALRSGRLGGAAFDVFDQEPPADVELLALPSFLPTPHIGGSTEEAVLAMGRAAIEGLANSRPAREFKA